MIKQQIEIFSKQLKGIYYICTWHTGDLMFSFEITVQIAAVSGMAESVVGATWAEGGTSDVEGVLLAGIVLEGLGSLADSAASGAARFESAIWMASRVVCVLILAASGVEVATVLDEAALFVLAASGGGSCLRGRLNQKPRMHQTGV